MRRCSIFFAGPCKPLWPILQLELCPRNRRNPRQPMAQSQLHCQICIIWSSALVRAPSYGLQMKLGNEAITKFCFHLFGHGAITKLYIHLFFTKFYFHHCFRGLLNQITVWFKKATNAQPGCFNLMTLTTTLPRTGNTELQPATAQPVDWWWPDDSPRDLNNASRTLKKRNGSLACLFGLS